MNEWRPWIQAEVVDELVSAAVVQVRGCLAVAHAHEAADVDDRKALFVRAQRAAAGTADIQAVDPQRLDGEIVLARGLSIETLPRLKPKRTSFRKLALNVWTYCAARLLFGKVQLKKKFGFSS